MSFNFMTAVTVCNDFGAQENKGNSEVDSSQRNTHLGFFSSSIRSKLWDEPVERWERKQKRGQTISLKKKKSAWKVNASLPLTSFWLTTGHAATQLPGVLENVVSNWAVCV